MTRDNNVSMLMRPELFKNLWFSLARLPQLIVDAFMNYKQHNILAAGPKSVQGGAQGGAQAVLRAVCRCDKRSNEHN